MDEGVRDRVKMRQHTQDKFDEVSPAIAADETLRYAVSYHLTTTKKKIENNVGHKITYLLQGQCMIG